MVSNAYFVIFADIVYTMDKNVIESTWANALFEKISALIENARGRIASAVNTTEVYTKYEIGRYIVEEEQEGNHKAAYGKHILQNLSSKLTEKFGNGWSLETLKKCRQFYSIFQPEQIGSTVSTKSTTSSQGVHKFVLSWSHYLILMRIEENTARSFYEIECAKQNWSVRWLQRQVNSSLYERLALSKDKKDILRLATEGQIIQKPEDIIKNPITLEFAGLKPDSSYTETKLETAIIDKMQLFLKEMGKGFLFEERQKRFTFDEDNYYVDLVCYNRLLQCYVLIDLKVDKLTHQDLGQMLMYVNYYDRNVKQNFEKPTIGILLCKEKKDALVELTLPKDSNIYAAQYQLYLPDKKILQEKLQAWITEFEEEQDEHEL